MKESTDLRCPICGGAIEKSDIAFGCSNWKDKDGGCKFNIYRESMKAIWTYEDAKTIIEGGIVEKEVTSKKGNTWKQKYIMCPTGVEFYREDKEQTEDDHEDFRDINEPQEDLGGEPLPF